VSTRPGAGDPIDAISALGEPTRRRLYELVVASDEPVGRAGAVAALGISRELAAFHLDRLAEAGLLDTEYRRLGNRTGPGAGRPAKLYRRAGREVEISLPPRRYGLAADLMATTLARLGDASGIEALAAVARERGTAAGIEARRGADGQDDGTRALGSVLDVFRGAGFEPRVEPDGRVNLRNCPFNALAAIHGDLTCGMNLAWAEGVVAGLGTQGVTVRPTAAAGGCCVVLDAASRPAANAPMREPGATP
jgi:predicted ArsR family transcriptional regulator